MTFYELYCEDCLTGMSRIPDATIDMVLADLPYGTTQCPWDTIIPFAPLWEQYKRVCKPSAAIVLFAQTPFDKVLGASNLSWLRYEWVWEKTAATGHYNAKKAPMKAHENLLVFYKTPPIYNPQKTTGHPRKISKAVHKLNCKQSDVYRGDTILTSYDSTERYPRSVLLFPSDKQKECIHPTQKPIALCEYQIKTYTNPGAVILDNCAGSGTTVIAALNTGRSCIAFENDPVMYNEALSRIMMS
jgi:DNA modification methylase